MTTTIPVKAETKKKLEGMKGKKTWDRFLDELVNEAQIEKRAAYRREMGKALRMGFEEVRVKKWAREY
jgi:hypothetical protein